jgi:hypothetical protein
MYQSGLPRQGQCLPEMRVPREGVFVLPVDRLMKIHPTIDVSNHQFSSSNQRASMNFDGSARNGVLSPWMRR